MIALNIGFIGGGALAEAVIKGVANKLVDAQNIFVADFDQRRVDHLNQTYHVNATDDANQFLGKLDLLIVAVKPKDAVNALKGIRHLDQSVLILSVVAGFPIRSIEKVFPDHAIIRAMPNVALAVGEGMVAIAGNQNVSAQQIDEIRNLWSAIGRCVVLDEKLLDAVTGLSGSGPAFAFLVIDALSDGGVLAGLPRGTAIELAAQTMLGAAKMVLEGGHPDVLRDKVTSPAGTTIEGIRVLERGAVRSAFIEAVIAATEKSKVLG